MNLFRTVFTALGVILLIGSPAAAQEPPSAEPADAADASAPPDAADESPAPEAAKRENRRFTLGIGPGFVFWPPNPGEAEGDVAPGFTLQTRSVFLAGGIVGFEWTNDIVFHDFKAMADGYRWYFEGPETEDEKRWQALKIGALWPGLILIPFGGANYHTGVGLIVYTSPRIPSAYFDLGANLNLYLRLSDPQFRADFGLGAYGGLGFDLSETIGAGARVNWGTPLVHNVANATTGSIFSVLVTLNISF